VLEENEAGSNVDWALAGDLKGRTSWITDALGYRKRSVVRADEILTAFMELEWAIHECAVSLVLYRNVRSDQKADRVSRIGKGCLRLLIDRTNLAD